MRAEYVFEWGSFKWGQNTEGRIHFQISCDFSSGGRIHFQTLLLFLQLGTFEMVDFNNLRVRNVEINHFNHFNGKNNSNSFLIHKVCYKLMNISFNFNSFFSKGGPIDEQTIYQKR